MKVTIQATRSKRAKQDDSIMATNNSSIVSKRSVERLYYSEPHFFRYFVKKPQRRSPLINRGYWLRMHAVEHFTKQFLEESAERRKVVLNLGSGYDPLAFQWLSKHPEKCGNVTFVDIDYPELLARKLEVISQIPQLQDLLNDPIKGREGDPALPLRNARYMALGCDLADTKRLNSILEKEIDLENCSILCIAEVSMTYMDMADADSLIQWASHYDDIRFCLLEQIIPNGEEYPFARKMIQHFRNLHTPLQSIKRYPNLEDQERRFRDAGWYSAAARSLWDLWSDSSFISSAQKIALNAIEPFDEWEEFSLFASHYFLLVAIQPSRPNGGSDGNLNFSSYPSIPATPISFQYTAQPQLSQEIFRIFSQPGGQRRFGVVMPISQHSIGHHGGLGSQSRLNSTDVYKSGAALPIKANLPPLAVEPRMCHTVIVLEGDCCLLLGGRTSPDCALADCWLYSDAIWERVSDLPVPLYRHCATAFSIDATHQGVLTYGGKSIGGKVVNDWYVWDTIRGWAKVTVLGTQIKPRFGAAMTSTGDRRGVLMGGMGEDGIIIAEVWRWSINDFETDPKMELVTENEILNAPGNLSVICRFGACLAWSSAGLFLVGGIANQLLPQNLDIMQLCPRIEGLEDHEPTIRLIPSSIGMTTESHLPLLIGHSVFVSKDSTEHSMIIVGGGAVCFSFGTYWNQCIWSLLRVQTHNEGHKPLAWTLDRNQEISNTHQSHQGSLLISDTYGLTLQSVTTSSVYSRNIQAVDLVAKYRVETEQEFDQIINTSKPCVIEGLDLGPCVTEWTLDKLQTKIGPDRLVVVHEASDQHMDFQKKNFRYRTKPFSDFVQQVKAGSRQYLRSLAAEKPAVKPADFGSDFPELRPDFGLPPQLRKVVQNAHSSPLRISGPVIMWLHYDVMANVLCQIQGSKRIILYPPSDVSLLDIQPGASSSSINVFDLEAAAKHPSLADAHPQEAILAPGDVLFIPPLWFHTAIPIENLSVSVNIFFRNLETAGAYAAGRDVYGNRDLQAYENGRKDIDRIVKSFAGLPREIGRFYLERLAGELNEKVEYVMRD